MWRVCRIIFYKHCQEIGLQTEKMELNIIGFQGKNNIHNLLERLFEAIMHNITFTMRIAHDCIFSLLKFIVEIYQLVDSLPQAEGRCAWNAESI